MEVSSALLDVLDEPSPLITIPVLRQVRIVNQTSEVDEARYSSISPLQPIDDMFRIEDNVIDIGLIIIIDISRSHHHPRLIAMQ